MNDNNGEEITKKIRLMSYPKIRYVETYSPTDIPNNGEYWIQEKVDGSQFRFSIDKDGEILFGSHHVIFDKNAENGSWKPAIDSAKNGIKLYMEHIGVYENEIKITFFAEYLSKPQHNTLKYGGVPKGNIVLFDVCINESLWLKPDEVVIIAKLMEIEPVNILGVMEQIPKEEYLDNLINNTTSSLGATTIEGVVVKNPFHLINYIGTTFPAPFMFKKVRESFKEENKTEWKKNNPSQQDFLENMLSKQAVWNKIIATARDENKLTGSMKDMAVLTEILKDEFVNEYDAFLKEELYNHFKPIIYKNVTRGLAEYYKNLENKHS